MNHFIENADFVSITVALVLLLMSITSWVVIIVKSWLLIQAKKQIPQAIAAFWQAPDLESACQASAAFDKKGFLNPLLDTVKNTSPDRLSLELPVAARVTRVLRDSLQVCLKPFEWGQVALATVGSISPFVGLLGTVWGIYHALVGMAGVGSLTLDQVSGPVGEALIMTAAGLAVALPAVLAYNIFGRQIGQISEALQGFTYDLRSILEKNI